MVVTGGSSGIGLAAAEALARAGDEVVLLGRDPGRLERAVQRVARAGGRTPAAHRADFAVLDEVRRVAADLRAAHPRIDVLVNNAGALGPWRRATVDGYDVTMQVNHLAGFLLSHLLLDNLRAATPGPARLVTTGSLAEAWGWLDPDNPFAPLTRYRSRWLAYGASKQANLLFTVEAARRWAPLGVVPTCFFPGAVLTGFGRTSPLFTLGRAVPMFFRTPERAADTLVWLATAGEALRAGGYFASRAPMPATRRATDPERARRLWEASLTAAGLSA
ncbi:SDR family NAD(P)-dependent oxidoreductase [Phytohabitans houttuyneae]|uniref:SDR family NAD(P)-dependent oxidoreductase n=1 Tax=Phytohabitans houttuyneae TaxID=1076126 RepID=UPI0015653D64|nr:SDR family NAD(P)-dependent oxidoreductase [Phytohabitans houttuyneae]